MTPLEDNTDSLQDILAAVEALPSGGVSFDDVYPVGSIYLSVNNANPSTLFGGTWEQIEDKFLLGAGTTHAGGTTGGEETHTLTIEEMPSHTHTIPVGVVGNSGTARSVIATNQQSRASDATGGDQPHNNMPPYIAVYIWKRTA